MMTFDQIKHLPKHLLVELYNTAHALYSDVGMALATVREELQPEWAHVCYPELLAREADLEAKLARHGEWMLLLWQALNERRPALRRVAAEDVLGLE